MRSTFLAVLVFAGCTSADTVDGGAARRDTGYCAFAGFREVDEAAPSPDGTGWCCPLLRSPNCDCTPTGGWVADPCECGARSVCDAPPIAYTAYTDAHGCEGYSVSGEESCLPPEPEPDAGP